MRVVTPFRAALTWVLVLGGLLVQACGGSTPPTQPPPPPPPVIITPPQNTLPSIGTITVQGRRPKQPARFADVREAVDVTATVTDAETPVEELTYEWSAPVGTFSGTGRSVTWTAPQTVSGPTTVTLTLKVVEKYGHPGQAKIYSQDVSATQTLALHDSVKEVGDMSVRFLTEFSKPQTNKDWRDVMKDFSRSACPLPREFDEEREQVENHYNNFTMHSYELGMADVSQNFGGTCLFNLPGDACASVRVTWDSTGPEGRRITRGVDHLTAVYAASDARWWLCSSRFVSTTSFGASFYSR